MDVEDKIGTCRFVADPSEVDSDGNLTMGALCGRLLDCAAFHADALGFGMAALNEENYTWVLSRLVVEPDRLPRRNEAFSVRTWVEKVYRVFTDRNFAVLDGEGRTLGYARSVWAMIGFDSRKPLADMPAGYRKNIASCICLRPCPVGRPSHIRATGGGPVDVMPVESGDIDANGHVNSVRYIGHVLDRLQADLCRRKRIRR